jgi:hypothetical protein
MSETKTDEELAREWMRLGGKWHLGMVDGRTGQLCSGTYADGTGSFWVRDERADIVHPNERYPDLSHPGTRAFLLEDVRRAWASEGVFYLEYIAEGRRRYLGCLDSEDGPANLVGDITETGTLIAALRAAPEKTK